MPDRQIAPLTITISNALYNRLWEKEGKTCVCNVAMSDHHHLHQALGRAGGTALQRTVVLPFDAAAYLVSGLVDCWRADLAAEIKIVGGELTQYVSASRQ